MSFRVMESCVELENYEQTSIKELGRYKTMKEAVDAAIKFRQNNGMFDYWEEVMKEENPDALLAPPFFSYDDMALNPDDDEGYDIFIVDEAQEERENQERIDKILAAEPQKKKPKTVAAVTHIFGQCNICQDTADPNLFLRNPSRLVVAVQRPPDAFPGGTDRTGFVDYVRRCSNAAYACKVVACDEGGAQWTYKKAEKGVVLPCLVWVPERTLDHHAPGGGGDDDASTTIIDTIHTDLIDPATGTPRASVTNLAAWCASSTTIQHLLLNKFEASGGRPPSEKEYAVVAEAIRTCRTGLQTFCACEWEGMPASVFAALETMGPTLKGVYLMGCRIKDQAAYKALFQMIAACPNLVFLGIDVAGVLDLSNAILNTLPSTLKVLYIRDNVHHRQPSGLNFGILTQRCPNLKVRLVFPDKNFNSK